MCSRPTRPSASQTSSSVFQQPIRAICCPLGQSSQGIAIEIPGSRKVHSFASPIARQDKTCVGLRRGFLLCRGGEVFTERWSV